GSLLKIYPSFCSSYESISAQSAKQRVSLPAAATCQSSAILTGAPSSLVIVSAISSACLSRSSANLLRQRVLSLTDYVCHTSYPSFSCSAAASTSSSFPL